MQMSQAMRHSPEPAYPWNVVLEFETNVLDLFSDQHLVGFAEHAKLEVDLDYENKSYADNPGLSKPASVTIIAIGRRLYIASSVKANNCIAQYGHTKIKAALLQSRMETTSRMPRRTNANCGEQSAANLYFTLNPGGNLSGGVV